MFCLISLIPAYNLIPPSQLTVHCKSVNFQSDDQFQTRQLPMLAGHCPLGGNSDRNVCNTHGEVHLALRRRTMLRPRTFSEFGTLPTTLALCQYFHIVLEETPCCPTTFGKMQDAKNAT